MSKEMQVNNDVRKKKSGENRNTNHFWWPTILQGAELMQNVMQDHKNLHLAELFEN